MAAQAQHHVGNRDPEELRRLGDEIWERVQRAAIHELDFKGQDALLEALTKEYRDFATSFPVPLRWMVQRREYHPGVFVRWMKGHVRARYATRADFLKAQGEYVVLLYKKLRPATSAKELARYREMVNKSFQQDADDFEKVLAEAREEEARLEAETLAERRRILRARLAAAPAPAAEIRVEPV